MRNVPETVHEYNIPRLNVIFVITSLLLLGSVVWMVWYDYKREWKSYQSQSQEFEKIKLILDVKAAEDKAQGANIEQLRLELKQAQAALEEKHRDVKKLANEEALLKTALDVATNIYQAEKSNLDEIVSQYDGMVELNPEDPRLPKKLTQIKAKRELLLSKKEAMDAAKGRHDAAQAKLAAEKKSETDLDKQVRKLTKERDLAASKLDKLSNLKLNLIDRMPMLEFAAPFTRIQQVIAENQKYDLNFTQVSRIDRCSTCHAFIERKDGLEPGQQGFRFSNLPNPWRSHPRLDLFLSPDSPHSVQKFGCSTCHFGWDRGVGFVSAAHTPQFYPMENEYVFCDGLERWMEPEALGAFQQDVQASRDALGSWKKALEERRDKLAKEVSDRSASTSPADRALQKDDLTRAKADLAQVSRIYASLPQAEDVQKAKKKTSTQAHIWHDQYQWHPMHHKEDPMRPKEFIESSCWKCHLNVTWIPQKPLPEGVNGPNTGDKINQAIRLVEQAGCYACHRIQQLETVSKHKVGAGQTVQTIANLFSTEPQLILAANGLAKAEDLKVGRDINVPVRVPQDRAAPSLTKIPAKVTREWMEKWLENPKQFRVNTYMPQFWGLDNNRPGMKYLSQDGKQTFDWGDRNTAEIHAITEYVFGRAEAVAAYPSAPRGNAENGKKLVAEVGCYGCHVEKETWEQLPAKDRMYRTRGPMLNGGGSKYSPGWLYAWLKDPSQYHAQTRMPNLRLSDAEAADITAYLLEDRNAAFDARTIPAVKTEVLDDMVVDYKLTKLPLNEAQEEVKKMSLEEKNAFAGEMLVRRYGCYSCHEIKGLEREMPVSIDLSDWASKKITQFDYGFIHAERKNHYTFLHQKLANPRSYDRVAAKRPQEYLKMPQYNFNEEQIELIMTAIMSLTSEKPSPLSVHNMNDTAWQIENGRWLMKEFNCAGCHVVDERGGAINAKIPQEFMRPPNLAGVGTKVRPDWLYHFLKKPGEHKYRYWLNVRMPTFQLTDTQINTLIRTFALLDKEPYPFEEATMTGFHPSQALIAPGQKLFVDFKCLSCHAVVSPEQARLNGKAGPDLTLVKDRMRPDGIIPWLRNPPGLTPGVVMPANWPPDGPSPFPDVLDGNTDTQIEAVRDYLMKYEGPPR